jgi:4-diphosphocytidyl-2C-methyl-D-erythritol 2-phosphate synthase
MIKVNAYAKLNLTLDVVGLKNGFHLLDSVVASVLLHDIVTVEKSPDNICFMDGVPVAKDNSVYKALAALRAEFGLSGYSVDIKKSIPLSGGLGGSTADGVAAVKAVFRLEDMDESLLTPAFLLRIGSDAPCMFDVGVKRVTGTGERVARLPFKFPYKVGIISGSGVSTAECYRRYDAEIRYGDNATERLLKAYGSNGFNVCDYLGNDLFQPAAEINPEIILAIVKMKELGAEGVGMSGSGSAVYGLFSGEVPDGLIKTEFI